MRYLVTLGYWSAAVLLLASVLVSFDYGFGRALFIATSMLPGMLCAKYFLPQACKASRRRVAAVCCVGAGVVVTEWMAMLLASLYTTAVPVWKEPFPELFSNPVFLLILLAAFVIPEELLARYLKRRLPRTKTVAFISERRKVTLSLSGIAYIESNDSEVLVHSADRRVFRTKTRISEWERLLDDRFVRIHRAYLVNAERVGEITSSQVVLDGRTFEFSRKYRERALARLAEVTMNDRESAAGIGSLPTFTEPPAGSGTLRG